MVNQPNLVIRVNFRWQDETRQHRVRGRRARDMSGRVSGCARILIALAGPFGGEKYKSTAKSRPDSREMVRSSSDHHQPMPNFEGIVPGGKKDFSLADLND
jgi:hypothetical protein